MADRLNLGPWGVDLDDTDFGRALAALGVAAAAAPSRTRLETILETAADPAALGDVLGAGRPQPSIWRPVPWDLRRIAGASPARWSAACVGDPATKAARAWETAVGRRSIAEDPRLAIRPFADDLGTYRWIVQQLLLEDVGATPHLAVDELSSGRSWHWPVRIGIFGDPASQAIARALEPYPWLRAHYRLVDLEVDQTADLVLLPDTIADALARLARLRQPLEIGCIVALGGLAGATDLTISSVVGALRLRAKPWGMAIADLGTTSVEVWISNLLTALTHDATLDVALRAALGGDGWLLLAEPAALEAARVSRTAARLAAAIGARGPMMAALPAIVPELLGLPLDASMGVLAMAAADPENFRHETRGATATAAMAGALADDRRRRPATGPPRWIQAEIRESETFKGRPRRTSLAPATLYGVDVWVGPETTGIRDAAAAFPDEELPRDGRTHRLTVVFTELDGARRTTTGHINLPPTGTGTRFRFFFRTGAGGTYRARVIVVYKSRVLQTAVLTAPIDTSPRSGRAKAASRIRLVVEAAVRPGLAGLSGRRTFGAAIVHNHGADGTASGTVVHDRHAVPLDLGGIGPTVSQITADLSGAAMDPNAYGPTLDAEATVRLLFRLAHHGVILHDDLFSRPKFKELVGEADRIQIVAADPNAVLPLEYVYDLPTPARPPKLCGNARQALVEGHCSPDNHQLDAEGHLDVVCPSGFWAMSRVIERHVADPEGVRRSGSAYSVNAEPVRGRNVLAGLSGAVFAASARVDAAVAGSATSVETALTGATGGHAIRVATWSDWVTAVGSRSPSLLVLLAHSARDDDTGQTVLEIEQDERRDVSEINRKFIGPDGSHPIVFLLGCDTAVPELQYQTFVSRFRQLDAALVVGTVATVAGSHAAGVAAALAQALHDADTSRQPAFGDLLRDVRRRLLADGEVMALSLTSYGDADWRFPASRAPD